MNRFACEYSFFNNGSNFQVSVLITSYCNTMCTILSVSCWCVAECTVHIHPCCALSEALYMAIGFQAGEEDVQEP